MRVLNPDLSCPFVFLKKMLPRKPVIIVVGNFTYENADIDGKKMLRSKHFSILDTGKNLEKASYYLAFGCLKKILAYIYGS